MNGMTYALVSGTLSTADGKYLCTTGCGAVGQSIRGIGRPGSVRCASIRSWWSKNKHFISTLSSLYTLYFLWDGNFPRHHVLSRNPIGHTRCRARLKWLLCTVKNTPWSHSVSWPWRYELDWVVTLVIPMTIVCAVLKSRIKYYPQQISQSLEYLSRNASREVITRQSSRKSRYVIQTV